MGEQCGNEIQLTHEQRITEAHELSKSAHQRINEVVSLIRDFTVEMRESNKNISELVGSVKVLTNEMSNIAKATEKHEDDITDIKDNMETKDTVLRLYDRMKETDIEYKKGMETLMKSITDQQTRLENHELEPAKQALAAQKAIRSYFIAGFGSIFLAIVTTGIMLVIFK